MRFRKNDVRNLKSMDEQKTGIGVENNENNFASVRNNNAQEIEAKYTKVLSFT